MPGKLFSSLISAAIAVSAIAAVNAAVPATPAEMLKVRHEHYEELGKNFKKIRDEMTAASPNFTALQAAAEVVHKATVDQPQWFPKGTGPEAGKTRALPAIWSKPDEFLAAQKKFVDRAPKLLAAAKAKDVEAVKSAFKELGGACKNCHDTFRSPDE
jgi:cytochrome c556